MLNFLNACSNSGPWICHADCLFIPYVDTRGSGSIVGIATAYGLDGPGIESRWERGFPHLSRPALWPTQPLVQWIPGLSRGKERPERDADPSPLLVLWSRKSRAIPLLPLWAVRPVQSLSACTRVHFTLYFMCIHKLLWRLANLSSVS